MKRIFYANGYLLTGDRTAAAVLEYASALAQRETSDTIQIPILLETGEVGAADLLVGPASQLMTVTDSDHDGDGMVDDEAIIASIDRRTAGLLRPEGQPVASEDIGAPYAGAQVEHDDDLDRP